ncbi:TPA: tRNA uracil 4-sulfurtransferase ThiI, partial [Listeria monocytogenes]
MEFDRMLIRYGELSTKGKNRKQFVTKLAQNVKCAMTDLPEVRIHGERDRMYVILNGADYQLAEERLKPIFGIQS